MPDTVAFSMVEVLSQLTYRERTRSRSVRATSPAAVIRAIRDMARELADVHDPTIDWAGEPIEWTIDVVQDDESLAHMEGTATDFADLADKHRAAARGFSGLIDQLREAA
jgi:hypothetical protein